MGKEPELMCEVEKFRLDIVSLNLMHGKGSGTSILERGCNLFHSGVTDSERLSACTLEFTLVNKRAASLCLQVGGTDPDCCLCL